MLRPTTRTQLRNALVRLLAQQVQTRLTESSAFFYQRELKARPHIPGVIAVEDNIVAGRR
jgi:hypothetical protein